MAVRSGKVYRAFVAEQDPRNLAISYAKLRAECNQMVIQINTYREDIERLRRDNNRLNREIRQLHGKDLRAVKGGG